ncbi:iron chelate uptake ABC transporter family permease subunit, partial [Aeromonas rivipollensis]
MLRYQAQLFWLGVLLLILLISLSLATGAGVYGGREVAGFLLGDPVLVADEKLAMIVNTLRLPRTLAALVVGVCLALAASMLQSATRNPLAEPGLLGVNAGAVFALVIGLTWFGVESAYGYLLWSGMGALLGNLIVLGLGLMV